MIKKLLTTFVVLTIMATFAMAQGEPIINSGTITNKGTIKVTCTVNGESILNEATGIIANNATGLIQFTGANPMFYNTTVGNVTNNGTIRFDGNITQDVMTNLGTNVATDRVGGTVVYNGTNDQRIQGGVYYTNLSLTSAGAKTFDDSPLDYYVSDSYTASGGDRTYGSSIFHYDGTGAQTIFAEGGVLTGTINFYNNLQLEGTGAKTIAAAAAVNVATVFNEISTSPLTMGDNSILTFKSGINADVAGAVIDNGGQIIMQTGAGSTFDVVAGGSVTVNSGIAPLFQMDGGTVTNAGTMTFNAGKYNQISGNSTHSGTLALAGGEYDQVAGNVTLSGIATIANSSLYNQTAGLITISGTTTVSSGTLDINGTNAVNDLVTVTAAGTLNLSAAAGLINMAASTNMLVNGIFTSAATTNLTFAQTSTVTYDVGTGILLTTAANPMGNLVLKTNAKTPQGNIFVAGNFSLDASDLNMNTTVAGIATLTVTNNASTVVYGGGALTDLEEVIGQMNRVMGATAPADMVFNNNATKVTITTNPGSLTDLTLITKPNDGTFGDFKATEDVKRSIAFDYNGTATDWVSTVKYGYKFGELPGAPAAGFDENKLRYREVLTSTTSEKVSTGTDPIRTLSSASSWGQVTLAGIKPGVNGGSLAIVADADLLFLRGTPTVFYTINDGRWSNPGTWDEGRQPSSSDSTVILHTVNVGFRRTGQDGNTANGQLLETTNIAGFVGLAKQIRITNTVGAALVFGDRSASSNLDEDVLAWATSTGASIINQNTTATGFTNYDQTDLATFEANNTKYNGLIIFGNTGGTTLAVKANQLINRGQAGIGQSATLETCLP